MLRVVAGGGDWSLEKGSVTRFKGWIDLRRSIGSGLQMLGKSRGGRGKAALDYYRIPPQTFVPFFTVLLRTCD